jgi:(p)ppGpp synthase/HD superfamily hydrolase
MLAATSLTDRFDRALLYATHVHGGQVRKGTTIPYLAHLLAVAATVLEYGGSEDTAIAGLLHDAAEDQGGEAVWQTFVTPWVIAWRTLCMDVRTV